MATGVLTPRARRRGTKGIWRVAVVPVACLVVALALGITFGHVKVGVLVAVGVALGAVNGLLLEQATARMTPTDDPDRRAVVKSSLGRLAIVTGIALLIAVVAGSDGWVLLLGLAGYQILTLLSQLGAAMKEARL